MTAVRVYTDVQIAQSLGVEVRILRTLRRRGGGPPYFTLANGGIRYAAEHVQAYLVAGGADEIAEMI